MSKENISNVIFYGPLGGKSKKVGGGESGNRRTISLLQKLGLNVSLVEKPYPIQSLSKPFRAIAYPIQLGWAFFKLTNRFVKSRRGTYLHISGFYNHLILIELIILKTSRLFGIVSIYELRAGGLTESYEHGSSIYKLLFRNAIKASSKVLVQGERYIPFLKSLDPQKEILHYPNFVLSQYSRPYDEAGRTDANHLHLVYFGRLTESKKIEKIIAVLKELDSRNIPALLKLIGEGDSAYLNKIIDLVQRYNLFDRVTIEKSKTSEEIFDELKRTHFFIFPTEEKREGHSNSLTEAMNAGVVPLCSNNGFNSEILPIPELIIQSNSPRDYVRTIELVYRNRQWQKLSKEVYDIVQEKYTETIASNILRNIYSPIPVATTQRGPQNLSYVENH